MIVAEGVKVQVDPMDWPVTLGKLTVAVEPLIVTLVGVLLATVPELHDHVQFARVLALLPRFILKYTWTELGMLPVPLAGL